MAEELIADPDADPLAAGDDLVAAFAMEGEPVRGRIVRLGSATVDEILSRHAYHPRVASLLGEMLALATLVGSSLKFDGKLIVQAQSAGAGIGAVEFVVAEYRTNGTVRGYARVNGATLARLLAQDSAPGLVELFGGSGTFVMTIDQGDDMERYQGTVELTGETLAEAASAYFSRSEQVPTRIRVACQRLDTAAGRSEWWAGGALLQRIAGDSARGDAEEAYSHSSILFDTLDDDELVNPYLSAGMVLFRLYHEDGVRLFEPTPVETACTCSQERIVSLLRSFGPEAAGEMVEADGLIRVRCEYCNRTFDVRPEQLGG
jgi:molecular chaperone Hsp33